MDTKMSQIVQDIITKTIIRITAKTTAIEVEEVDSTRNV